MKKNKTLVGANNLITSENFRERYKELSDKASKLIVSKYYTATDSYKFSTESLYRVYGDIFQVSYIKDNLQNLVLLYQEETTSPEDKEILRNLIIYSNIAIILKIAAKKPDERERDYFDIDDLIAEGLKLAVEAIETYNPAREGKTKTPLLSYEINKEDEICTLVLDNYLKSTISLEINGELSTYSIKEGKVLIDLSKFEEEFSKVKIVKEFNIEDATDYDDETMYIVLPKMFAKFITYLTNSIDRGMQQFLLRVTGIKHDTYSDVTAKKVQYGIELYKYLAANVGFKDYFTKEPINVLGGTFEKEEDIVYTPKNTDTFYDDYYDKVEFEKEKEVIVNNNRKTLDDLEPSHRWLALYLITSNKNFEIIPVDDKFDLIILGKNTRTKKNEVYSNYFEHLEFTPKMEKEIHSYEKKVRKSFQRWDSYHIFSPYKINDEGEEESIFESISDDTDSYAEIMENYDKEILINRIIDTSKQILLEEEQMMLFDFLKEPDFTLLEEKYGEEKVREFQKKAEKNIIDKKMYSSNSDNLKRLTLTLVTNPMEVVLVPVVNPPEPKKNQKSKVKGKK